LKLKCEAEHQMTCMFELHCQQSEFWIPYVRCICIYSVLSIYRFSRDGRKWSVNAEKR
jgi:hypothetical protein